MRADRSAPQEKVTPKATRYSTNAGVQSPAIHGLKTQHITFQSRHRELQTDKEQLVSVCFQSQARYIPT